MGPVAPRGLVARSEGTSRTSRTQLHLARTHLGPTQWALAAEEVLDDREPTAVRLESSIEDWRAKQSYSSHRCCVVSGIGDGDGKWNPGGSRKFGRNPPGPVL